MKTNIIIDLNNIGFITRFSKLKTPKTIRQKEKGAELLIFHEMVSLILKQAHQNKADGIVLAMDSKKVWRRDYYDNYKRSSTTNDDLYFEDTINATNRVAEFFAQYTSATVISVPRCEADDIISVWCQMTVNKTIIISSDKDYVQLLNNDTTLFSPQQNTWRTSEDPGFDLFLKCIRGDKSDTIRSAYPRIREVKLKQAWDDNYHLLNLMETVLPDGTKVGDNLDFNAKLIDLTRQPPYIRKEIRKSLQNFKNGRFNKLTAIKYLKDLNLGKFVGMFDYKEKALKRAPEFR
ncbi:MAG: hypothetical protein PF440_07960 [Thiomicrorhabdus sp.]|jgi:hypothetical protein|nr:hypothetical protein [Thiomicrorhabdus sp.]